MIKNVVDVLAENGVVIVTSGIGVSDAFRNISGSLEELRDHVHKAVALYKESTRRSLDPMRAAYVHNIDVAVSKIILTIRAYRVKANIDAAAVRACLCDIRCDLAHLRGILDQGRIDEASFLVQNAERVLGDLTHLLSVEPRTEAAP